MLASLPLRHIHQTGERGREEGRNVGEGGKTEGYERDGKKRGGEIPYGKTTLISRDLM